MSKTLEDLKSDIEEILGNYIIYGKVTIKIETTPRVIEFNINTSGLDKLL